MNEMVEFDEKLLTPDEVCSFLRISKQTLHAWVIAGRLQAYKLAHRTVRFRECDVLALFAGGEPTND
jgi:excisionase family DNA binding protein